jgi:hypothetical protein
MVWPVGVDTEREMARPTTINLSTLKLLELLAAGHKDNIHKQVQKIEIAQVGKYPRIVGPSPR